MAPTYSSQELADVIYKSWLWIAQQCNKFDLLSLSTHASSSKIEQIYPQHWKNYLRFLIWSLPSVFKMNDSASRNSSSQVFALQILSVRLRLFLLNHRIQ